MELSFVFDKHWQFYSTNITTTDGKLTMNATCGKVDNACAQMMVDITYAVLVMEVTIYQPFYYTQVT